MIQSHVEQFCRDAMAQRKTPVQESSLLPETLDEAILFDYDPRRIIVNEAFFGRKPVEKIEKAVKEIAKAIEDNPDVDLNRHRANTNLERAICDVFGFKRCSVYWNSRRAGASSTIPQSRVLMGYNPKHFGFNDIGPKKGFYDENHRMVVVIDAQTTMFKYAHLSAEEVTAVLLHEIGHNFDFTVNAIMRSWLVIAGTITELIASAGTPTQAGISLPDLGKLLNAGIHTFATTVGGEAVQQIMNLDNAIERAIPPLHKLAELARKIGFNVARVIGAVISPVGAALLPAAVLFAPFSYAGNYFLRKSEVFADSTAAAYGYGAELASALNKLDQYIIKGDDVGKSSILDPFYKLALFENEVYTTLFGGHRSTQQRLNAMSASLDKDLEASGLSARDRQSIKAEKAKLMQQYGKLMAMDEGMRSKLIATFRRMINNWYNGKPYMFVKNFTGFEDSPITQ